ncbi:TonB-dependent receptor plug domain-containing protein [Solimonas terrae]|uniref:TonB-dependent receptor plug domain-containing protein n=1 Tax=Solimonas terrae TaxID=1396819 RepID=UPI00344DA760
MTKATGVRVVLEALKLRQTPQLWSCTTLVLSAALAVAATAAQAQGPGAPASPTELAQQDVGSATDSAASTDVAQADMTSTEVAQSDAVLSTVGVAEVIVTGTRRTGMQAADSPAPVQVLSAETLQNSGTPDLISSLAATVPSFTAQAFGGDQANQTLSAKLRGLSPNHALVLINGKRRHTTANFAVLSGPYQGGAAADLNFIPVSAIDHIEVLTDGAAAQYGTDAIAGVINIILKKDASGGSVDAAYGGFKDGGGETDAYSANVGFGGDKSYLNLSAEVHNGARTNRSGPDYRVTNPDNLSSLPNSNMLYNPDYPNLNQILGSPEFHKQIAFFNAGYDFGPVKLYSFGSYGLKQAASEENYRLPGQGGGYTDPTTGETSYLYPYGFQPKEATDEDDLSFTAGLEGMIADMWHWDLSSTYGRDRVKLYTRDTMNFTIYGETGASPTDFYDGTNIADQLTTTLDLSRDFDVGMATPLNVAFGVEQRHETYESQVGDYASYYGAGASSFPGIKPADAGKHSRNNYAGYIDLSVAPVEAWQIDVAGRHEHFSDFGNTTIGKLTSRYDFNDNVALRGTVSTGFRAPTLAEEYYSATNVGPDSAIVQMAPNAAAAQYLGLGDGLKPEKSTNFSLGLVTHVDRLTATLDAYQIEVRDRIVGSGTLYSVYNYDVVPGSEGITDAIVASGSSLDPSAARYIGVSVFANGLTTRTRGVDMVLSLPTTYDWGHVDWTLSGNYNKTKVTKVNDSPTELGGQPLYDATAIADLETASPLFRINLVSQLTAGRFGVKFQETLYGKSSSLSQGSDGVYYKNEVKATPITDLELSFTPVKAVRLSVGANNLFNEYPDKINPELFRLAQADQDNSAVSQYPSFSPFGFNGAYYYGKVAYSF